MLSFFPSSKIGVHCRFDSCITSIYSFIKPYTMKIYRYSQTENYTNVVHAQTNWHTTIEGATKELLSKYPDRTQEQMDEDLEVITVVVD